MMSFAVLWTIVITWKSKKRKFVKNNDFHAARFLARYPK